ncbi:hypothetical protein VER_06195 [Veillonella sp. R32]|nr:hypothetical protein VER_06195 [Veillonella sp. R32]
MSRLKREGQTQNKLSKTLLKICPVENSHIMMSFANVTHNKHYNFKYFAKNFRLNLTTREELDKLLVELSSINWQVALSRRKNELGGVELLTWDTMKNIAIPGVIMSPDSKVHVFRFGKSLEYRLCGIKDSTCHNLKIIAYDFDYTLYNHGS